MKFITLKSLSFLFLLFCSCSNIDAIDEKEKLTEIDYSLYESRAKIFDVFESEKNLKSSLGQRTSVPNAGKKELFKDDLERLKMKFNTNLEITDFDKYQIENSGNLSIENYLKEGLITELDYSFLKEFQNIERSQDFEAAIKNMENKILNSSLSKEKFNRYTLLINTLLIANDYYQSHKNVKKFGLQMSSSQKARISKESASCAVSIAANAVSTYGLTSCFFPGPQGWAAVAGKALSLAGIYLSC